AWLRTDPLRPCRSTLTPFLANNPCSWPIHTKPLLGETGFVPSRTVTPPAAGLADAPPAGLPDGFAAAPPEGLADAAAALEAGAAGLEAAAAAELTGAAPELAGAAWPPQAARAMLAIRAAGAVILNCFLIRLLLP